MIPLQKLTHYQVKTIEFIRHNNKVLCCNDMGTGKTLCAIATIEGNKRTVIIVPNSLKLNWYNELHKWDMGNIPIYINGFSKKINKELGLCDIDKANIIILNYEQLAKYRDVLLDSDYIILDEAHKVKNPRAICTKILVPILRITDKVLFLTGTPIKNKIQELYTYYVICTGSKIKYWDFCLKYSNLVIKQFGGKAIKTFEGVKNVSELHKQLEQFYIRYTDTSSLPELIELSYTEFCNASYTRKIASLLNDFELSSVLTDKDIIKLANYMQLRVALSQAKIELTINKLNEIWDNTNKEEQILIFTNFVSVANEISTILSAKQISNAVISGEISTSKRQEIVDKFQSKGIQVLIGTIGALSVGFTLTNANHLIFNDLSFVPADNMQAMKRHHRIGANTTKYVHYINAKIPNCRDIDNEINEILLDKMKIIKEVVVNS